MRKKAIPKVADQAIWQSWHSNCTLPPSPSLVLEPLALQTKQMATSLINVVVANTADL